MNRITLLFLCFAMTLIGSSTGIAQKKELKKTLSNELIWASGEFSAKYVSGVRSMNDGAHYTSLDYSEEQGIEINKYSYKTGEKVASIASSKSIFSDASIYIDDYEFSADETQLLITTETESIYRHSTKANYYIYNIEKNRAFPLTDFNKGKQRLACFSPQGNAVAFVRDNDIYYVDVKFRKEIRVTDDGKMNEIINGATDWVYEEEFGFDKGLYWSPKGNRIAYYKFDESQVKEFQMAMYGSLYPEQYTFKYPKAGEKNSKVSVYVYDLASNSSKQVDTGKEPDQYIPRIKWTKDNDALCVMRLNRHQNHLEFLITDISKPQPFQLETSLIYEERSTTYIEINDNLIFLDEGKGFLWNSEIDGYNHIYQFDMRGKKVQQVTSGTWDVITFYGYDEKSEQVFYSSSAESALEEHIYAKGLNKRSFIKLTELPGNHSADFSKSFSYFIDYHTDANTPYYITMKNGKGKTLRVLEDNADLKATLASYNLQNKEFFTFTNSDGIELNCWMIKPANFDPNKEYPVYVNIYGGPGHNTVVDSWEGRNYLFHQYLAQEGYIVASVDPRGTMYRGKDFKHSTYLQLGKLETQDFIDFGKYLGQQTYVDANRIGIQGWSYGGYMTSLAMTKGAEVFSMGIAVAPVTNWRYYDSIYTERFMRTPQENASGYDDNSPINHVEKLKGPYLLVHGSADDNVHYQNTMEMIDALVKANKQFDLFIYPNKNHGIYGGNTRLHLFTKMSNFIKANL